MSRSDNHIDVEALRPEGTEGSGPFGINQETLSALNEDKSSALVARYGGIAGLAVALDTSLTDGVEVDGPSGIDARRSTFGANVHKQLPPKGFFKLWYKALKNPVLIILTVAAVICTVIGSAVESARNKHAYVEGIAIAASVFIVSIVGALTDWQKDRQMQVLNARKSVIEIKVLRGGHQCLCLNTEVVVGDIVLLHTGDKLVADGYCLESNALVIDEASLTGEADPVRKGPADPWIRSGTQVNEGSGSMLVLAVGEASEWGKTMALVQTKTGKTPLQEKLDLLVIAIGKLGVIISLVCFLVLMIRWIVDNGGFPLDLFAEGPLEYFIIAVTIIVVTVPEGLPLAVTIALASTMKAMLKDHNFVRVLSACETMGGATTICSDKTGTLTENRMTVVDGWFAGAATKGLPDWADLPQPLAEAVTENVAVNSSAYLVESEHGGVDFVGNRTECALLMLLRGWGQDYRRKREALAAQLVTVYDFTSARKMSSALVRREGAGLTLLCKGAAEIVVGRCTRYAGAGGAVEDLGEGLRQELLQLVTSMASRGLRTLCLAMRDMDMPEGGARKDSFEEPPETDLTLLCIVGIKDPVRQEVPEAVATCQRAGIVVRMVTGDNIHTACHIARECGILTPDGVAMEGPEFRNMDEAKLRALLPKLQVLARSSPTDKHTLVHNLKLLGEVVAVTGDGTNDAPALKESDVGLAMGIAGTEVAKDAADIVILDDNFSSIVKAVLWGRNVFANIRKFLQFQLTISLVALIVTFIAAVSTGTLALNVLQLLWVNLIMNSFAALAFALEKPGPELMDDEPHGRDSSLVSRTMAKNILVHTLYQSFWLFLIFYGMPRHLPSFRTPTKCEYFQANTNLCCLADSQSCLDTYGGIYQPGETPLCQLSVDGGCVIQEPRPEEYCDGNADGCERWRFMEQTYFEADDEYAEAEYDAQEAVSSMVFNTFICMQLFNFLNARKLRDEYNIFAGLFKGYLFIGILFLIAGLQVLIMFFLQGVFRLQTQSGLQWGISLLIGAGGLPLALIAKFVTRRWFPIKEPTPEELMKKRATFTDPKDLYRRHWWQWLRPPPPKHIRELWKRGESELAKVSGDSALKKSSAGSELKKMSGTPGRKKGGSGDDDTLVKHGSSTLRSPRASSTHRLTRGGSAGIV
uniref:Calcium-transporting ATPase n=2 Tax=Auxenochlorella protothecoides TaxID=3075 RepID=A0A1D2A822_AUXPR